MALLRSVDNVPGVQKYEYREKNYYGKYRYKLHFYLLGSNWLWRVTNEKQFDHMVANRRWSGKNTVSTRDELKSLKIPLLHFKSLSKKYTGKGNPMTIRAENGNVSVFCNDLTLLLTFDAEMKKVFPTLVSEIHEAQIATVKGIKFFVKKPKHSFRVYLKSTKIEDTIAEEFKEFIYKNKKYLYPSAGLKRWETSKYGWLSKWLSSSYFIDYDDESFITLMLLKYSEYLGNCYKLEKHPELSK